jgi:hypothetical protein
MGSEGPLGRLQLKCDGTRWRKEGKWRGNWRMEWVDSTLHTTSEHGVSSITTADAHTSAAISRLNWRPHRFKWTRPFCRKTKSGFCACAITFQQASTTAECCVNRGPVPESHVTWKHSGEAAYGQYAVSSDTCFCVYLLTLPAAALFSGLNSARNSW